MVTAAMAAAWLTMPGTAAAQAEQAAKGEAAAEQAAPGSRPVAVFDGGAISSRELEEAAGPQLIRLRQQEYDVKVRALKDMIFDRLVEQEAAKEGKTPDQLIQEAITSRLKEPPAARVDQLMKTYRSRLAKDDKTARGQIVRALKQQQENQLRAAFRKELLAKAHVKILIQPPVLPVTVDPDDPVRGPADAPVTIVEFSDFQCPYCARVQESLKKLLERYPTQVRLVFKNSPLPIHSRAKAAAEAALCADEQGKFWEMHDWLFAHQKDLSDASLEAAAKDVGLDAAKFKACVGGHKELQRMNAQLKQARQLGVNGTPTFFIDGRMLRGAQPYEALERAVQEELDRLGVKAPAPAAGAGR